jgi:hypothetical protein
VTLPRPLDEHAEKQVVPDRLARKPDRIPIGFPTAHEERPERSDERTRKRDCVDLRLRQVCDPARACRPDHGDVDPVDVVDG